MRWLLVTFTFSLISAQYEQQAETHGSDSYEKPLKIFGEANKQKAQEYLLAPAGLPVVDPLASYGREPPVPADLPGSEPLPPGHPTTAASPAPEEAQRPGGETPISTEEKIVPVEEGTTTTIAGPVEEKKEEATPAVTEEKTASIDDKYQTVKAEETSILPASPSISESVSPAGNEQATTGGYQSSNEATVPAETKTEISPETSQTTVSASSKTYTTAAAPVENTSSAQTEVKPESYEKPSESATKVEAEVPSVPETGSSPAAPVPQPASESTPSVETGYESGSASAEKTSLPTETNANTKMTQGQSESTKDVAESSSSASIETTPQNPKTIAGDFYVTSPATPEETTKTEEKKPTEEQQASKKMSSISSTGTQGEIKPENTPTTAEHPAGSYERPIKIKAESSSTESPATSTEQPKEEVTGSSKSAEIILEHPPILEEGYAPTGGEKSVEVAAEVTPDAETTEGSGTTSAEKTNEYPVSKGREQASKSGEAEGSGVIPTEEGDDLASPGEQSSTTASVTVFPPSAPTAAEIQAATLAPYSAEVPESVESSGKMSSEVNSTEEATTAKSSESASSGSTEQKKSIEGSGYIEKTGGGEVSDKSSEKSQETSAEIKSPVENKKAEESQPAAETKGTGEYDETAKKVEGEKDLSEEKIIITTEKAITSGLYVTAPGERTAKSGVTLAPESSRNDGEDVKSSIELSTSLPSEKKAEKELTTATNTKITDKPSIEFSTDTTNMKLEPSGYEMGNEPVVFTPDLPPIKPEEAVGYDGIAKEETKQQHDLPQKQDFNVENGETKVVRKIDRKFFFEERPKWTPYRFDCNTEEDEKGALCKEWALAGLCEQHRPTMFLFCRKTCLCTGPFARRKRFASLI